MLKDGQRVSEVDLSGEGGGEGARKAAKNLFPVDDEGGDDDSSDGSASDSDDDKDVGRVEVPARSAKRGVARAAHAEEVWARLQDMEGSDGDETDSANASVEDSQEEEESDVDEESNDAYASAEPSSVDELIEDLAYVDPSDEAALKLMYQKIRLQTLNQQRF